MISSNSGSAKNDWKQMKLLFVTTLIILFYSINIWAGENTLLYKIEPGRFHTGGKASLEKIDNNLDNLTILVKYKIDKKFFLPVPSSKFTGENLIIFPKELNDEAGYLELETKGEILSDGSLIKFIKRVNWKEYQNAYEFILYPANQKSEVLVVYHPDIASIGIAHIEITVKNTSAIMDGYKMSFNLN
jgi:hypothetical protein